jgi:branched-chain amino acid transport system permease protein
MVDITIFTAALINSSILTLMTIGLTLTYLTTKVPNFAHGTFSSVAIFVTLTISQVFGLGVYYGLLPAFLIGGVTALAQYVAVLRPLTKRNASIVTLMVATIAFDILLISILNIYADYLTLTFHVISREFTLSYLDVSILGQQGVLVVAPVMVIAVITSLYLLLNKTKFGIAMRATIENPPLAGTIGINTDRVYVVSWFLAGGIAGLAGSLVPLWFESYPEVGSDVFLIAIFAAAVIGGLYNIWGAVIGGFTVGIAESVIIRELAGTIGSWIIPYQPLIPLIAMVVTLLIAPSGITGINFERLRKRMGRGSDA